METKVYASKSTLGVVTLVFFILTFVFAYLGIGKRFEDVANNKDYQFANAIVKEVSVHEYRDSEGDWSNEYAAILEVQEGRETFEIETDVIFEFRPDIGEEVPLLYKEDGKGGYTYRLAKKDWLTGEYIFEEKDYDGNITAAACFLAFGLVVFALMLPSGKAQGLCVGGGMLFLGLTGIFLMVVARNLGGIFMLFFGAIGVLILHRTLFVSSEKQKQMIEDNNNARLFVVRDVFSNKENETETVIFALLGNGGMDSGYFSYDCKPGTFPLGSKWSANINKLVAVNGRRTVEQYNTLDVSTIPAETFRKLSKAEKKTFEMLNKLYMAKTGAPFI